MKTVTLDMRSFGISIIAELFQIGVLYDQCYLMSSIDLDAMMHLNMSNLVSAGAECRQHHVNSAELDGAHRIFWEWTQNMNAKLCAEELMSKWMNACGQHSSVLGLFCTKTDKSLHSFTPLLLCSFFSAFLNKTFVSWNSFLLHVYRVSHTN